MIPYLQPYPQMQNVRIVKLVTISYFVATFLVSQHGGISETWKARNAVSKIEKSGLLLISESSFDTLDNAASDPNL